MDASAPAGYTRLRACLKCKLIKTEEQWVKEGCQNCEDLDFKGNSEDMISCTSARFEGIISLINPKQSWVAKWNHLEDRVPGCYAVDVQGSRPDDYQEEDDDKI